MLSRKEKKVKLKRIFAIFLKKPPYQRIGKGAFFKTIIIAVQWVTDPL